MKRLFAKLLSFLLIVALTFAIVCRLSSNFLIIYRITGIKGICTENGSMEVYTNRADSEKVLIHIPYAGYIMEYVSEPVGFAVCIVTYLLLLTTGRKKSPQWRNSAAVYRRNYNDYGLSEEDTSEVDTVSETSLSETS